MIPRLSSKSERKDGRGQSFRDLSSYLFTGNLGKPDPDRVEWCETLNCHCSDPSQAWAEMAWTYQHADALKAASGARRGGQKNEHPVWHVSLNWRDDQKPTREQMIIAARSVMEKFGLQEHQALIVSHGDTDHAHVHLMVNTVNPFTGKTVDVSRASQYRLSAWASAYERENGQIFCQQREENWKSRGDNKSMHKVWNGLAGQNPALGEAKLKKTYDKSDSRPLWQLKQQAKDLGLSLEGLEKLTGIFRDAWNRQFGRERERETERPALTVNDILRRLTRNESTFTRKELEVAVTNATKSTEEFTALFAKIEASPELVRAPNEKDRYSTQTLVRTEAEMAQAAGGLAATSKHGLSDAARVLDVKANRLSAEQYAALEHVTDDKGLACVVGYAGTGKSTMLGVARQLWEASGYTVKGFALSGIAAESLQGGSGIQSKTLHSLIWNLEHGRLSFSNKDILVVDEAGMVGSRQMHAVLTAAEKAGAKVVLVGDPSQLQAIDAGGAYRAILGRTGAAHITQVRRQRQDWQQGATVALSDGKVSDALKAYQAKGAVHAHASKDTAISSLVTQWAEDLHEKTPALILAATRKDVANLNQEARAAMRSAGLLGADVQVKLREEVMDEPVRDFRLRIAEGERLLFTKNDKTLNVKNGTLGTLESAKGNRLTVRLDGDDRRRVEVDLSTYRNLAYGYALTVHKAQGVTVDRAHVLAGRSMDRHSAYVALSRHRDSVTLHYSRTDARDLDALSRQLGRDRPKGTSLEYFETPQRTSYQGREKQAERSNLRASMSNAVGRSERVKPSHQFKNAEFRMQKPSAKDRGRER